MLPRVCGLNAEADAERLYVALRGRSPLIDPRPVPVHVTALGWKHILKHKPKDILRRKERVSWIEPTVTAPAEIRENKVDYGYTYLAAYKGYNLNKPEAVQYFIVITKCEGPDYRLVVTTLYPIKDEQSLANFQKEELVWAEHP